MTTDLNEQTTASPLDPDPAAAHPDIAVPMRDPAIALLPSGPGLSGWVAKPPVKDGVEVTIKVGSPLTITIASVFPGDANVRDRWGEEKLGAALVTSAAKNPMFPDAVPQAFNFAFIGEDDLEPRAGQYLVPGPSETATNVVFHTPALTHESLTLRVRQTFDKHDESKAAPWVDLLSSVLGLPAFFVPGPAGKSIRAVVKAVGSVTNIALKHWDSWFDNQRDWFATWTLRLAREGRPHGVFPQFVLLYGDDQTPDDKVPGFRGERLTDPEMKTREEQYFIDLEGKLRYADAPGEVVLQGEPYVVLELDSRDKPELEQWAATSVTATLSQRFLKLDENGSGAQDVVDVLKSFNDVVMVNQARKLSESLQRPGLPPNERQDIEAKRDALLKNIQDEAIREILKK